MKPTNRHEPPFPACSMQTHDVDSAHAVVHVGAAVSDDALIGAPAEWRGQVSRYPAVIGDGVVVSKFATVDAGVDRETVVGAGSWVCTGAYVGHDTQIGEDCDIAPGALIAGCCTIGDRVKVGIGAVLKPHVTIGDDVRIGAGAVVIRDIPAGETWAGNPARRIR